MKNRKPPWLRKRINHTQKVVSTRKRLKTTGLCTVCESARCPNIGECFEKGTATFMIMGEHCTRNCRFCDVAHNPPSRLDPDEGRNISAYIAENDIRFAVITSVTRDDLADGGASHFASVVASVKKQHPNIGIELLVPDFMSSKESLDVICSLDVEVTGHNIETVRSLYPAVRAEGNYNRALEVLTYFAANGGRSLVKSGLMVGLGEGENECRETFADLAGAGVSLLTIGQYLQPSRENAEVKEYIQPERFNILADLAREAGIGEVVAGPYVRSSYMAEEVYTTMVANKVIHP